RDSACGGRCSGERGAAAAPGYRLCFLREGPAALAHIGQYAAAQLVMVHAAGGGNHQFLGGIGAAVVLEDVLTGDGADTARGAADRAAQRVVTEDLCEEAFVHDLDRVVLAHRQFFED